MYIFQLIAMDKVGKTNGIDIKENALRHLNGALLNILLKDRSSGRNLIWATDTYLSRGFGPQDPITVRAITGAHGSVIKPRVEKSQKEQRQRIKNKAEVFTPSWVCNKQNNLVDNAWFGRENVFNVETGNGWRTVPDKIAFPAADGKTWQDYVSAKRMEITCGEAPYLTSRYDTVTGKFIAFSDRIGLFDRKLRVVCENVDGEEEWMRWATVACQSVYGFDFQGDNVLIARENLLFAFADAYFAKFDVPPIPEYFVSIAKVLAWNIFQMDGLKFVIPYSCTPAKKPQMSLFDEEQQEECPGCAQKDDRRHTGVYCKIMDWTTGRTETFLSQIGRESK